MPFVDAVYRLYRPVVVPNSARSFDLARTWLGRRAEAARHRSPRVSGRRSPQPRAGLDLSAWHGTSAPSAAKCPRRRWPGHVSPVHRATAVAVDVATRALAVAANSSTAAASASAAAVAAVAAATAPVLAIVLLPPRPLAAAEVAVAGVPAFVVLSVYCNFLILEIDDLKLK